MKFVAIWRHWDGSLVEFSETGWKSADSDKDAWLTKMSRLCSAVPTISPMIRMWLEENCELDFQRPPDLIDKEQPSPQRQSEIQEPSASDRLVKSPGRRNSSKRYLQLVKRRFLMSIGTIGMTWRKLVPSRGMSQKNGASVSQPDADI
jgi:hypothetical protein